MQFELTEEHFDDPESGTRVCPERVEAESNWARWAPEVSCRTGKMMGESLALGMMVDPKYGGGMDAISYVPGYGRNLKVDASFDVIMSVNNSLVWGLEQFWQRRTKQKYRCHWPKAKNWVLFAWANLKPAATPPHKKPPPLKRRSLFAERHQNW